MIEPNRIHDCGELPPTTTTMASTWRPPTAPGSLDNWIYDNADRGVQLFPDSQRTYVARNVIDRNGQGVIFSRASRRTLVEHNVISNSLVRWNLEDWELTGTVNVARATACGPTRTDPLQPAGRDHE